jgi:hypothetical protein
MKFLLTTLDGTEATLASVYVNWIFPLFTQSATAGCFPQPVRSARVAKLSTDPQRSSQQQGRFMFHKSFAELSVLRV